MVVMPQVLSFLKELVEIREEAVEGLVDVFRDGPDLGENGHEIMIPLPAGYQVEMEMIGNPCAGGRTEVAADIQAMRSESVLQDPGRLPHQQHERGAFLLIQFGQAGDMPERRHKEMPVAIRETIEQDQIVAVPVEQEMVLAVRGGAWRFEEAGR
jgi:hypothetical protein